MTINGGSEFMTYGGNDDYYTVGGGFPPTMEEIKKLLTMPNIITAIVLVVIIIFLYNNMTSSKGSPSSGVINSSYVGNNSNLYVPSRISNLENSEYTYGSGTQYLNTDPVSRYYTFVPA